MSKIQFWMIACMMLAASCKYHEGEGGLAAIEGKVYALDYNSEFTFLKGEYYAPEENVYIVYGDNEFYDDRIDTHYDGSFRFDNLRKGTYTIYVYSDDSSMTAPSGVVPVIKTVEITDKKQTVDVGDLVIIK